jgi:hypothetical protein
MRTHLPPLILFAALSACAPTPESYRIPPQHEPVTEPERLAHAEYVRAVDLGAENYFDKDVKSLEEDYRWTGAIPQFRFFLYKVEGRRFQLKIEIHPTTFKDTGPVEITILINKHSLATVRYETTGRKVFEKAVPREWLMSGNENIVSVQVHNPWRTPTGDLLGFIFHAAGFIE